MNDLINAVIVGVLVLFIMEFIVDNVQPDDAEEGERQLFRFGGATVGAWLAMSMVLPRLKK